MKLASAGVPIKEIVRRTGHSRKLVRQVVSGQRTGIFRARQSSLEAWLPFLDEQWAAGCHNASELWRRLKRKGFRGCLSVVSEWARRHRRAEIASDQQLHKVIVSQNDRTADDDGSGSSEGRHGADCRHRSGRAHADGGA